MKNCQRGTFPLYFKLIECYHKEYPILTEQLNSVEYIKGYFCRGPNTMHIVTFNDKIGIL